MLTVMHFFGYFIFFISTSAMNSHFYSEGYRNSCKALLSNYATVNIILSAPHAGSDMPEDVSNRTTGGCRRANSTACSFHFDDPCFDGARCPITTVQDFGPDDHFAEAVADELNRTYALIPFIVIAKWNRNKIDFNREINEATFNHPEAIKSYRSYHEYLGEAIATIQRKFNGKGLLLDVHQHAQGNYTMVGTLITGARLNRDDLSSTSIELLIQSSCPQNRSECIRGSKSFGTFLESNGLGIAYPSFYNPKPGNKTFYSGGFITQHYSSRINVIQAELSYVVRNEFDRLVYAEKFARALVDFMNVNGLLLTDNVTVPHSLGTTLLNINASFPIVALLLLLVFLRSAIVDK